MKEISIFLFSWIMLFKVSHAQVLSSFYLNESITPPESFTPYFTDDAVYFSMKNKLIKTDYEGNWIWSKSFSAIAFIDNDAIYFIANPRTSHQALVKSDTAGNIV